VIGYYVMFIGGVAVASFGASDVLIMVRQGRVWMDRLVADDQLMLNGCFAGGLGLVGVL